MKIRSPTSSWQIPLKHGVKMTSFYDNDDDDDDDDADDGDDQKHADAAHWLLCGYQLPVILFLIISDIIFVIIFVIISDIMIPRQPAAWEILLAWTASLVSYPALRLSHPETQVIITRMDTL